MNLKHVDIDALLRRVADKRIEDAMAEGKFDDLPGKGQPIEIDEAPVNEKSKALWWALRLLKQNDFVPDEVRWRKSIDRLKADLYRATDAAAVRKLGLQINVLVYKLNTLGTNAIRLPVAAVDIDAELRRRDLVRGKKE